MPRPSAPAPRIKAEEYRLAFERHRRAMERIPKADLLPINVDIPSAVVAVFRSLEVVAAYREKLSKLGKSTLRAADNLGEYAAALLYADAKRPPKRPPKAALAKTVKEGIRLRKLLLAAAAPLAHARLLEARAIARAQTGIGYRAVWRNLRLLAHVFREAWPKVEGKTTVSLADVARAEAIATAVRQGLVEQARFQTDKGAMRLPRQRAFTLMFRAYDEVRQAILYLQRNEPPRRDPQTLASLYAGRWPDRKKVTTKDTPPAPRGASDAPEASPSPARPPRSKRNTPGATPVRKRTPAVTTGRKGTRRPPRSRS